MLTLPWSYVSQVAIHKLNENLKARKNLDFLFLNSLDGVVTMLKVTMESPNNLLVSSRKFNVGQMKQEHPHNLHSHATSLDNRFVITIPAQCFH